MHHAAPELHLTAIIPLGYDQWVAPASVIGFAVRIETVSVLWGRTIKSVSGSLMTIYDMYSSVRKWSKLRTGKIRHSPENLSEIQSARVIRIRCRIVVSVLCWNFFRIKMTCLWCWENLCVCGVIYSWRKIRLILWFGVSNVC